MMISLVSRQLAFLLFLFASSASARHLAEGCDSLQEKYNATAGAAALTPLQRLNAYLHLLDTTPDDPEDCITTKITQQIAATEKTLIVLEIDGRMIQPDWVLACSSVNLRNGECKSAELDTSSSLPEKNMGERLHKTVPRSTVAVLKLKPGYRARILAVFADTGSGLKPMKIEGNRLFLGKLESETDHPAVTVMFRREDSLRFRKVVWHLYPLEPARKL